MARAPDESAPGKTSLTNFKKVVIKSKGHYRNILLGCDDILIKQAKGMKLFIPKNCYRMTQGKKGMRYVYI